jgi:phosphate transport system permease protein
MVCGVVSWAPNPADGWIFFVEPTRPLASTIIAFIDDLSTPPMRHTLYALAAVLLLSSALLSFGGWAAKQPMKRYGAGV